MLNTLVQVIVAIFLILILALIAYSIYNNEIQTTAINMTKSVVVKKTISIFKGIMELGVDKHAVYNTTNTENGSYRNLQPSINQKGGSEYSYNFWLYYPNDTGEERIAQKRT